MNKTLLGIAAAAGLAFAGAAHAADITIATEGAWEPYNFKDENGNLVGYEVELIPELCQRMGLACEIVAQDWDGIIPGLLARQYDAIMADMSITDERKRQIAFSDPYHHTPPRWVGPTGWTAGVTEADVAGKAVGAQKATIFANYLSDELGSNIDLKLYDTQEEAFLDLVANRIDLVMADHLVIGKFLATENGADFMYLGEPLSGAVFGIGSGVGLRQGEDELREKFNAAITETIADGTLPALWEKWHGVAYVEPAARAGM